MHKSQSRNENINRNIIWLCHQTIEKFLKGVIVDSGKKLILTHDLLRLLKMANLDLDENQKSSVAEINIYYFPPPYPDLIYDKTLPEFTSKLTKDYLTQTKELLRWLKQNIQKKIVDHSKIIYSS